MTIGKSYTATDFEEVTIEVGSGAMVVMLSANLMAGSGMCGYRFGSLLSTNYSRRWALCEVRSSVACCCNTGTAISLHEAKPRDSASGVQTGRSASIYNRRALATPQQSATPHWIKH